MTFDEMDVAIWDAKRTISRADVVIVKLADLLCGHLKVVGEGTLGSLKRELRDFNMHTGCWKE